MAVVENFSTDYNTAHIHYGLAANQAGCTLNLLSRPFIPQVVIFKSQSTLALELNGLVTKTNQGINHNLIYG